MLGRVAVAQVAAGNEAAEGERRRDEIVVGVSQEPPARGEIGDARHGAHDLARLEQRAVSSSLRAVEALFAPRAERQQPERSGWQSRATPPPVPCEPGLDGGETDRGCRSRHENGNRHQHGDGDDSRAARRQRHQQLDSEMRRRAPERATADAAAGRPGGCGHGQGCDDSNHSRSPVPSPNSSPFAAIRAFSQARASPASGAARSGCPGAIATWSRRRLHGQREAAVDDQGLSPDHLRVGRAQERDRAGDVVRYDDAACGVA